MRIDRTAQSQTRMSLTLGACALLALCLCAPFVGCAAGGRRPLTPDELALRDRAVDFLTRAATSDLEVVRSNALEALAEVAPERGKPLFEQGLSAGHPQVRFAAALALGDVRDCSARRRLQAAQRDADARVRLAAAYALYRCGTRGAAETLVRAMNSAADEHVRADAAFLIGRLGERKAIKRLRLATVREQSNLALAHIHAALAQLGDREMRRRVIRYVLEADTITRTIALQTLIEMEGREARDALRYRLANQDYLVTQLMAARALGRLGSAEGYDLALKHLNHAAGDPTEQMGIRVNAALALGDIGDPRALGALERLASDQSDPRVQVAAALAICEIIDAPLLR